MQAIHAKLSASHTCIKKHSSGGVPPKAMMCHIFVKQNPVFFQTKEE